MAILTKVIMLVLKYPKIKIMEGRPRKYSPLDEYIIPPDIAVGVLVNGDSTITPSLLTLKYVLPVI